MAELGLSLALSSSSLLGAAVVSKLRVQGDYTLQDIVSSNHLSIIDLLRIIKRDRDMDRISFKKGARISRPLDTKKAGIPLMHLGFIAEGSASNGNVSNTETKLKYSNIFSFEEILSVG